MIGFICSARAYRFNKMYFEDGSMSGPYPLKKNGDPKKKVGKRFYDWYMKVWIPLSEKEKESYFVGGGCQRIEL